MADNRLCPIRHEEGNKLPWCWRERCALWKVSHVIEPEGIRTYERCSISAMADSWVIEDEAEVVDE